MPSKELNGDLLADFSNYILRGFTVAIMPVSRVHVEEPIQYRHGVTFYPPGWIALRALNVEPNNANSRSLAEVASGLAGIDIDLLESHPLVAFPCRLTWEEIEHGHHEGHCELIREMSSYVDRICLNVLKFHLCELGLPDTIPGRAGSIVPDPMMAGAVLYSHERRSGKIIGGSVFSHAIVKGLGLPLERLGPQAYPRSGEVGNIVNHALELFASALEASTPTLQFVQAISLLEFLADPFTYQNFKEVKKIIARYVATDVVKYDRLLERFNELTGKKADSGEILGYRTRIVHMGQRLEDILPKKSDRRSLFRELQGYASAAISHMSSSSASTWSDYLTTREHLQPFRAADA